MTAMRRPQYSKKRHGSEKTANANHRLSEAEVDQIEARA
jgi:hypothetical protein